jgi:ATP-binding cassette subfamily C protein
MPRYIVETALIFAIAIFILVQTISGDLASSAATIGVFLSGGLRLTASLLPLQSALLTLKQSVPSAEMALALLGQPGLNKPTTGTNENLLKRPNGISIEMKGLSYSYPGKVNLAVDNISIEISGGSQAAFIGISGSGKSTLADLILGLLEPRSGSISLDGLEPRAISEGFPGLVSYVPQRPGLVAGTIAENIALGIAPSEVDINKLEKAISDAHLSSYIESLPFGIETDIGKRKDELSGGQMQRIGLARALYSQPRLLIMDEATSALDAESEHEINLALDEMRGKVTVVLIAHRLNTVQNSDIVFLLEDGKISNSGTFNFLRRTSKVVQNLSKLMAIET